MTEQEMQEFQCQLEEDKRKLEAALRNSLEQFITKYPAANLTAQACTARRELSRNRYYKTADVTVSITF